jgi:hypothetical protein
MASKVDTFVEQSKGELTAIWQQLEQAAIRAQVLANRWQSLGKLNMPGWAEYGWASQPFTAAELAAALNGLSVNLPADTTNLTNIHVAQPVDKIVKASL